MYYTTYEQVMKNWFPKQKANEVLCFVVLEFAVHDLVWSLLQLFGPV